MLTASLLQFQWKNFQWQYLNYIFLVCWESKHCRRSKFVFLQDKNVTKEKEAFFMMSVVRRVQKKAFLNYFSIIFLVACVHTFLSHFFTPKKIFWYGSDKAMCFMKWCKKVFSLLFILFSLFSSRQLLFYLEEDNIIVENVAIYNFVTSDKKKKRFFFPPLLSSSSSSS